ncbi:MULTISPECIES: LysR substrate-binding domain-containing protein [Phaeobacter]|uniref:LysR substrate-binding domain-containing protein n=1 Tax=Phaeobacter gallaeciensis TaxID=60890 RepID=A0ABD4XCI8_9RHOB|nr:LysR substrate-binding domain-containing protein [Phaeobacter gallaeciensis]MDF1773684.1 LysR substrate-binding domain-containing protein [Pseudophaeobacter sp. bin_em_oilr2.035]MDE4146071.1 LysR substrate-binding domain-containing protein [Phaeobacter gallaeciensis]MDE4158744.1 LysR substrate-binding domain-containing protein [Phaeobacter gallaeciensis]MDE4162921.1 LysR substrate-binding domain-containing protein [Phaeobacter gallaeciensis]MDE4167149.1 LysR substrate-binding domain-contain
MIAPRRFLPSIPSLLALEAVDRLGSASAAAEDLSLTQSAVSRQLKQLEEQMGVDLIARDQMRMQLTPAGAGFAQEARGILTRLAQASVKLRANPDGGSLNLSILPSFGLHWLAPRLKDFVAGHPGITVNLQTHNLPFSFEGSTTQAAIHYGTRDWPGVEYLPLMPKHVLPVCAPGLMHAPAATPEELLSFPLLHLETHPDSWEQWFALHEVPAEKLRGMLFDQSSAMTQAAVHGLGVALLPTFIAEAEIAQGRLQLAVPGAPVTLGSYFLVWPQDRAADYPLLKFRDWLVGQIGPQEVS